MNQGKYIFAQLTDFLPRRVFDRIVSKHDGNKYVKSFTCWNQMLCMVFGQLTARDSMRDLVLSLEGHQPKFYHLGFGSSISRRNLGTANERRSYKIFEKFAYVLIDEARRSCYKPDRSRSCYVIQETLGGRTVFQMDEAASKDKILLGNNPECSENPDILCDHCLLPCAIVGNKLKVDRRIYEILSISLLDKTPIKEILTKYDYKDVKELNNNQLIISGF